MSMVMYLKGTRPMNINNRQVANISKAVDKFESAIKPQITPHQANNGIRVSLMESMFIWRLESILARCDISASFAKSEGWKVWLITGIVIQRLASFRFEPNFQAKSSSGTERQSASNESLE